MVDLESEVGGDAFLPPLPTFVPRRYQPGSLANWSGHLAFANDLIADLRPAMIVELGTHYGESYFGMCQSVLENGVDCVCYAVDHWLGEEHAGNYGEEVFTEVNDYNRRFYKSFSYLLRSAFDDALCQFSDDSIDILHIDGLHTYEAGRHDFESWFAKVKRGGIVLLGKNFASRGVHVLLASWWGNGLPRLRWLAGVRARPAPLALRHWPDTYGWLQSRIFGNGRKPDRATPRVR